MRLGLVPVSLERVKDQTETAVRHDGAFERRISLQTDNQLVITIYISGSMSSDRAGNLRDVEHALATLFDHELTQCLPDLLRALCRQCEKCFVAFIWLVVLLDEI